MTYQTVRKIYPAADLPFLSVTSDELLSGDYDDEIRSRVYKVIRTEAPITQWLLIKRVINSFDLYKAGSRIRVYMEDILGKMKLNDTRDRTGTVYWQEKQKPAEYNIYRLFGAYDLTCRDVQYIPDAEIANAAASVAEAEILAYEDLARKTAVLLGYTRMGSNVTAGMKRGIDYALKTKRLKIKDGKYIN